MSRKVKEPLDLWIAEWEREVHERKNPFSRKPTSEERAKYELRLKEEEDQKEEARKKKKEEEKQAAWLRSLPEYRRIDMKYQEEIYQKFCQLAKEIATAFSELAVNYSHVRNPWSIAETLREAGRQDLADRIIGLHKDNNSRKMAKDLNREVDSD